MDGFRLGRISLSPANVTKFTYWQHERTASATHKVERPRRVPLSLFPQSFAPRSCTLYFTLPAFSTRCDDQQLEEIQRLSITIYHN
jgi:hypothetical protein